MNYTDHPCHSAVIAVNTTSYSRTKNDPLPFGFEEAKVIALLFSFNSKGQLTVYSIHPNGTTSVPAVDYTIENLCDFTQTGQWKVISRDELKAMVDAHTPTEYIIRVQVSDKNVDYTEEEIICGLMSGTIKIVEKKKVKH